jgi:adenylate cyclase
VEAVFDDVFGEAVDSEPFGAGTAFDDVFGEAVDREPFGAGTATADAFGEAVDSEPFGALEDSLAASASGRSVETGAAGGLERAEEFSPGAERALPSGSAVSVSAGSIAAEIPERPDEAATAAVQEARIKVRIPIAVKLVTIVTILLVLSLGAITALVSKLVSADVRLTAEDNNFSINRRTAESVQSALRGISAAVTVLFYDLEAIKAGARPDLEEVESTAVRYFFEQNPRIAAIGADGGAYHINEAFFRDRGGDGNMPRAWSAVYGPDLDAATPGVILLRNATPFFGIPMLVMRLPLDKYSVKIFFGSESFNTLLGEGVNVSFLLDEEGSVLLHNDINMLRGGVNLSRIPFIKNVLDNSGSSIQSIYTDNDGNEYFGAVQRLSTGPAVLITIIRSSIVFGGIVETTLRNIVLSAAVLAVSIILIILFSRTISKPLHSLTDAVAKIENGNYDLQLKVKTRDELGVLTQNFIGMGNSLENFEKFTNKAIVKLAKQGKLSRSGANKRTTVCFALIRDFHEIADGLDAASVVDFVNDYLSLMVPCITMNGGGVDKFLTQGGVIIMALWGTPETAGSPEKDAFNCICSALSMRAALRCLNQNRMRKLGRHIPAIKLGCGINSGDVVAGQIGSEERMEYTVIGDAVNLAARIEGPNDLFDTDILISEETFNLTGGRLLTEEMRSIEVKGKEKPLRIFSVVNVSDEAAAASILDNLRKLPGVDAGVCKKCVGPSGPRTMEEVRKSWLAG